MDRLIHYGIKGMKWGVRRYQTSTGILTNAGKRRYRSAIKKKVDSNVSQKLHATNDEFERTHQHLLDDDYERYFTERDKYEQQIWDNEWNTTGKQLKKVLDDFHVPAKSIKELDYMMKQRLDSVQNTVPYKSGRRYVRKIEV